MYIKSLVICLSSALLGNTALAQSGEDRPTNVGGVIFGHWGMDLTEGADNANEFDIDRVYLTARRRLGDSLAIRVTTDVGREKEQPEDQKIRLYLKYAYLQWNDVLPGVRLRFGAAGTGLINYSDGFIGIRYIRKSFTDQYGVLDSSDIGVHAMGEHADGLLGWQAGILNGSGYGSPEEDAAKTAQLRLTSDVLAAGDGELPISGFVSTELGTDGDPTLTYAGALGFRNDQLTAWAEYVGSDDGSSSGSGYSATLIPNIPNIGALVLRYDHWDGNTETDDDAETTWMAGLERDFHDRVSAALLYENTSEEATPDVTEQGVFIRMQAGF